MTHYDERGGNGADRDHLSDEVLSAYLDHAGEFAADPAARAAVEAHLHVCATCRGALQELETTVLLLRSLPQVAPRRTFVLTPEQTAARQPRTPVWTWPVRWATALAMVLLIVVLAIDFVGPHAVTATIPTPQPVAVAPSPTAVATCDTLSEPCVAIASADTPIIFPTATPALIRTSTATAERIETDWRPAEVTLGTIVALGVVFGFLLPLVLQRRQSLAS